MTGAVRADASAAQRARAVAQRVTFVLPTTGALDSRTRRMSRDLARRGHEVRIVARRGDDVPEAEVTAEGVAINRVPAEPADALPLPWSLRRRVGAWLTRSARPPEPIRLVVVVLRTFGQARTALTMHAADEADLYHAMGFLGLPVARRLRGNRRDRSNGGAIVYDARDLYAESNNIARLPGLVRGGFRWLERAWALDTDAVVTVNVPLAAELERRWGVRPQVVMNGQPLWSHRGAPPNHLRRTLGLPAGTPVVLYHGGFMPDRGLPQLIEAMRDPSLGSAHLVLLGSGALEAQLRDEAAAVESGGRVHLLPPVSPDDLLDWVASADVAVMPNQPRTLNERLSTPNKLFEALAAGVPVVSSDFAERRRIIIDEPEGPLGAVCDPTDPAAIAAAIAGILALPRRQRDALRDRCLRVSALRYGWDRQLDVLLDLYGSITGRPW